MSRGRRTRMYESGRGLSRRQFLAQAGATVGSAMATGLIGCRAENTTYLTEGVPIPVAIEPWLGDGGQRPNFIFILTDDHRWDHLSIMGHPFLETPNMDRLAREGVLFENAFVTTSLCSPSRASILTGQYARTHGVQNNLTPWNEDNVTFLELLAAAGYRNAFIGKWHMPGRLPSLRGVDQFVTFTVQAGQGRYFDCPLVINGEETERPGRYITRDLTEFAIDFIRKQEDNPFCLYLSHKAVHHQFLPPSNLEGIYANADLSMLPEEYFSLQTTMDSNIWEGVLGFMENHYRNYCETLVGVDRELGRLLEELDDLGLSENTAIIYASDNGYSWGEHVITGKRWAFEENMRIPFIVRYPGGFPVQNRRQSEMVLNIDLGPTILDLAGLPIPEYIQGSSIRPLLMQEEVPWRDSFLYEYFKDFPYNVPAHQALRTDQYLYVTYEKGREPELYAIKEDPRTLNDIINTDEGRRVEPSLRYEMEERETSLI